MNQDFGLRLPASHELHLWLFPTGEAPAAFFRDGFGLLSLSERERNRRFAFEKDRTRYLLTRVFIRRLLGRYLGEEPAALQFQTELFHRPVLVWPDGGPKLDFNISHAGEMIACGIVSSGRMGIDVEPVDRDVKISQISHFFSTIEVEELARLPAEKQKEHFLRLWTLKEAYIKARGDGLSLPLDSFAFYDFREAGMRFRSRQPEGGALEYWSFLSLSPVLGYRLAAAWSHSSSPTAEITLRLRKFQPLTGKDFDDLPFSVEYRGSAC